MTGGVVEGHIHAHSPCTFKGNACSIQSAVSHSETRSTAEPVHFFIAQQSEPGQQQAGRVTVRQPASSAAASSCTACSDKTTKINITEISRKHLARDFRMCISKCTCIVRIPSCCDIARLSCFTVATITDRSTTTERQNRPNSRPASVFKPHHAV